MNSDQLMRRADFVVGHFRPAVAGTLGVEEWRILKNREGSSDEPVNHVDLAMRVLGLGRLTVTPERIELLKILDSAFRLGGAEALDELLIEALVRRKR